ncbi:MAG: phosphoenolpyruvate--protein phosphotransferase [Xenococcaceae cyanobacterium MO_188.B32]|nr:phosphoenolpyruvate--protein phosphotransferase [Xenococcaceae cyanobacterium MO_188.B32]
MVSLVLVSHSLPLAESIANLIQHIVKEDVNIAIAAGVDDPEHPWGTDVIKIQEAIESVYSDDGVLVLMDLGSAVLSAEMALEFLSPEQQTKVKLCAAPLVEGAIAASVIAATGANLETVITEAQQSLTAKLSHLEASNIAPQAELSPQSLTKPLTCVLTINNPLGLHLRPAAQFVSIANQFNSDVRVKNITRSSDFVNGKSVNQLMLLEVRSGEQIEVEFKGDDATLVLQEIKELVKNNFGEVESLTTQKPNSKQPISTTTNNELIGIPASPGIVIAPVVYYQQTLPEVKTKNSENPEHEWQKLQLALQNARQQIENLTTQENPIFQAHLLYLDDPQLHTQAKQLIFEQQQTASYAWKTVIEQAIADYQNLEDEYLQARAIDLLDIGSRVLKILLGIGIIPLELETPSILIAPQLTPSEVAQFNPQQVLGICTAFGSATDHSAIVASLLGIPMVVGMGEELLEIPPHTRLQIDGTKGIITLNPSSETSISEPPQPSPMIEPAITRDGHEIGIVANIIGVGDAQKAIANGAEGVGLLRTEFLYLDRVTPPTEEEQLEFYQAIGAIMGERPITIRTLDIGADKSVDYLDLFVETNPGLGWRGIRQSLDCPDLFKTQLRAILRASARHKIKLMFPMVTSVREVRAAKQLVSEVQAELRESKIDFDSEIAIGIMVETPAAVAMADLLAKEVDFFSIGTNDLSQYIMAADRTNTKVAALADAYEPAVLRMIRQTVDAAHNAGITVSVCGQLASDPKAIPILLGLGVDELSVNPPAIPGIKAKIASLNRLETKAFGNAVLQLDSAVAVREYVSNIVTDIM